jgi:hypothetical protein
MYLFSVYIPNTSHVVCLFCWEHCAPVEKLCIKVLEASFTATIQHASAPTFNIACPIHRVPVKKVCRDLPSCVSGAVLIVVNISFTVRRAGKGSKCALVQSCKMLWNIDTLRFLVGSSLTHLVCSSISRKEGLRHTHGRTCRVHMARQRCSR